MSSLSWDIQSIEDTLESFTEIQSAINYQQAQQSLQNLVNQLDLSAEEQQGLEQEIEHLSLMLEKMENSRLQIVAFGLVGRGKSSVLNALLGNDLFQSGPLHGVTTKMEAQNWHLDHYIVGGLSQTQVELLDTPGLDEVDGENREQIARQIAKQADLILFIVAGDLSKLEYNALSALRQVGKPIILVFNKIDQYPEADRQSIYEKIRDERVKELLWPEDIVMVSASPLITQVKRSPDGKVEMTKTRGEPEIEPLKLKILEILQTEGKSLIALNSLFCADNINEQIVKRKMNIRNQAAEELIQKSVLTKAISVGLNPVTALDLLTGAVIDVAMILSLSRLYGIEMTQTGAIALLRTIGLSMGSITASDFLASIGLASLKGLLGISTPLTGGAALAPYLGVALTQAGVAGFCCYAIGQITKTYLANGACWGPNGPKAVAENILSNLDETSIMNRIKEELKLRLSQTYQN